MYDRGETKMPCEHNGEPRETLVDVMRDTSRMAADVLGAARRISGCLFGNMSDLCEKEAEPRCFRDELQKTRYELMATMEELAKMSALLGM